MHRQSYRSAVAQYLTKGPGRTAPPEVQRTLIALAPDAVGLEGSRVSERDLEDLRLTLEQLRKVPPDNDTRVLATTA